MALSARRLFLIFMLTGIIVRLVLAPFTTMPYDMSYWAGVMNAFNMGQGLYDSEFYWYSPTWGYILSFLTPVMNLLGINIQGWVVPDENDHIISYVYAAITEPGFNLVVKLPLIISDILIGALIGRIVMHVTGDGRKSVIAVGIWMLFPLAIWNSAVQGQFDTLAILGMVGAFYFMMTGKYVFAGALIAFATITKMFPAVFILLMIGYVFVRGNDLRDSLKGIATSLVGALVCVAFLFLPVAVSGDVSDSFLFLTDRIDSYSSGPEQNFFQIGWGNVFTILPLVMLLTTLLTIRLATKRDGLEDRRFLLFAAITIMALYGWPNVPPYSQYALVMVPLLIALQFMNYDMRIPLVLTALLFTISVFAFTGPSVVYPLSLSTGIVSPESIESAISAWTPSLDILYDIVERIKFLPALLGLLIILFEDHQKLSDALYEWRCRIVVAH